MGASTKAVPQPIRQQIADRHAAGDKTADIANEFHVSRDLVREIASAARANGGVAPDTKPRGRPADREAWEEIGRRWLAGVPKKKIAREMGKSMNGICLAVRRMQSAGLLPTAQPNLPVRQPLPVFRVPVVRDQQTRPAKAKHRVKRPKGFAFGTPVEAKPSPCFRCDKPRTSVLGLYCRDCERVYSKLRRRINQGRGEADYAQAQLRGQGVRA